MARLEERPSETARRLLAQHGLSFQPGRRPVPASAWRALDADLATGAEILPVTSE